MNSIIILLLLINIGMTVALWYKLFFQKEELSEDIPAEEKNKERYTYQQMIDEWQNGEDGEQQ